MKPTIGFIGQGFIGKNYANDFDERGYSVVRYGVEPEFVHNKDAIASCDIVFVAVPTPSTPDGFDDSIVREVLALVGSGKTAVIKSTIAVGTTESLQEQYPDIIVMHSPEFLREKTAAADARNPDRNIVGIVCDEHQAAAETALAVMAPAQFNTIVSARTAELVKYAGNVFLTTKVIFMNLLHDLASANDVEWSELRGAMIADPRIGESHTMPIHESGHGGGAARGAGGHCFIKDLAAFREMYERDVAADPNGARVLRALEGKNCELLCKSGKDLDLLEGVYGKDVSEGVEK